jgi:hypothetical protein
MADKPETRQRLLQGYLSLERLERDRIVAADPELGKQTEYGIIQRELLELELQDIDEQLERICSVGLWLERTSNHS